MRMTTRKHTPGWREILSNTGILVIQQVSETEQRSMQKPCQFNLHVTNETDSVMKAHVYAFNLRKTCEPLTHFVLI